MAGISHPLGRVALALSLMALDATGLLAPPPAVAQNQQPDYSIDLSAPLQVRFQDNVGSQKAGSVATSSVGAVGQRREQSQDVASSAATARFDTRIANRVQSRIRNRIDRFYDPEANTTSPFKIAADQTTDINQADR